MRFTVELPPRALNVVGEDRDDREYNAAAEQWRGECAAAMPPYDGEPIARAHLSIVAYVGTRKPDGRFRPKSPRRLWPVLDPLFEALSMRGVIDGSKGAPLITTGLFQAEDAEEGIMVRIDEVESLDDDPGDDDEMVPGPPCGRCGEPQYQPITPWKSNFHDAEDGHEWEPGSEVGS